MKLAIGLAIFFLGQVLGWYHLNMQKFSDWWKDKPLVAALVLGVPTSLCFWHAWRIVSEQMGSVWSARFIGSCTGFIVFPVLTWFVLGESMFTTKTMLCLTLSIMILLIQIYL
jgi:hypothetical protein